MALFGNKKTTKSAKEKSKKVSKEAVVAKATAGDVRGFLLAPRITEKSAILAEKGVYTFDVAIRSNKIDIVQAVKSTYGVTPLKVAMISIPARKVFVRGRVGTQAAGKKAIVYLKKGDTIAFA